MSIFATNAESKCLVNRLQTGHLGFDCLQQCSFWSVYSLSHFPSDVFTQSLITPRSVARETHESTL